MNHSWMLLAALGCTAAMADSNNNATIDNSGQQYNGVVTVSYTHLTLPTSDLV